MINFNKNGTINTHLPIGDINDSNRLYLVIQIVDDTFGVEVDRIKTPIQVTNSENFNTLLEKLNIDPIKFKKEKLMMTVKKVKKPVK